MLLLPTMTLLFASPAAVRAEPLPGAERAPTQQTTIVRSIESSTDDAEQTLVVTLDNEELTLGAVGLFGSSAVGLRFTDIAIPQGATIDQATLMLKSGSQSFGSENVTIRGHAVANSPTFSENDGPSNRQHLVTGAYTAWSLTDWSDGSLVQSPDLSGIIQELVSRSDWLEGNAISLLLSSDGLLIGASRRIEAIDSGTGGEAQLTITYSAPLIDADLIATELYLGGEFQPLGYPDLVVTSVETNQPGYPLNSMYTTTVVIMNLGAADSGPFEVTGQIGRRRDGEPALTWGLGGPPFLNGLGVDVIPGETFLIESVANLGPGEMTTVVSSERSLTADVFTDRHPHDAPLWAFNALLPPWGQVFLKASASAVANESSTDNNTSVTSFIYPNYPEDPAGNYDPNQDADGDGFYPPEDCDDSNPFVHPEQEEIVNDSIDNDCQGGDFTSCHIPGWDTCDDYWAPESDVDGDGWTPQDGDCNPGDADIHPGAIEEDNDLDDDCDSLVDEGFDFPDPGAFQCEDLDGDGWGCGSPDCEPLLGVVNPGANEVLDGIDNDCDGFVDEGSLVPDWTITFFELDRRDSDCIYNPSWHSGPEPPSLCGIQATYEVANLGDSLGPNEIPALLEQVRIMDLAGREYPSFAPYYAFPSQAYAEYMACAPAGLIASIPGGMLGEENTTNNLSLFYLDEHTRDLDIVHDGVVISYPFQTIPSLLQEYLRIRGLGEVQGSCPPRVFFWNYSIQLKILVEGEQIFLRDYVEQQSMASGGVAVGQQGVVYLFPERPGNNDAIRIEILLNGDERFDEDPSNNLCVIDLTYDRNAPPIGAYFDSNMSLRMNDRLDLVDSEGCGVVTIEHGYTAWGSALTGGPVIQLTFVVGLMVVLGAGSAGGGILAGQIAQRFGVAGAGRVLSAVAGALLGGAVLVAASIGIASIGGASDADLSVPSQYVEPDSDNLAGLILASDEVEVPLCDLMVASSMEAALDTEGVAEDIVLNLQDTGEYAFPADSFFQVTLWDGEGNPAAVLTTEEASLSLASEGLFPEIGTTLFWQVVMEAPDPEGGDQDVPLCLPMIRAFNIEGTTEDVVIEEPDEPEPIVTPTEPSDTTPPSVKAMSAVPNPTLTTVPVTISATIADESGVASTALYYQVGKGDVEYGGEMLHYGGGQYSLQIGPLVPAGTYNYYIVAADTLGNATCTVASLGSCPSGSFVVNVP
jgi:hypothetical protein